MILEHIIGKNNLIANILFKARYINEKEMMAYEDGKDGNKKTYRYLFAIKEVICKDGNEVLQKDLYEVRPKNIRIYLNTMKK